MDKIISPPPDARDAIRDLTYADETALVCRLIEGVDSMPRAGRRSCGGRRGW